MTVLQIEQLGYEPGQHRKQGRRVSLKHALEMESLNNQMREREKKGPGTALFSKPIQLVKS